MPATSFYPPERILMGPGPSDIHPRVLAAMSKPTLGHLDPEFVRMMDDLKILLRHAFQTKNPVTFAVSAPGSAGMECCFVNLVEPGESVVVCQNGVFGGRMRENVERCGGTPIMLEDTWGKPVDPNKLDEMLKTHPEARIVAFVHAETSTGVRSDAENLIRIAHNHDCIAIVDTVTSLGGIPVLVDAWGADAVYSGSQKCLSCTPGLSPVTFGDRAVAKVKRRRSKVQSWFLDLNLIMSYWEGDGKRTYHHTAPIHALYALHEALVMLHEEGLENAWRRHDRNHQALRTGIEAMGLSIIVEELYRLPQLNAVSVPEGVDEAAVRGAVLKNYSLEIGAGLGVLAGKIWRVGLMGYASNPGNVLLFLSALDETLHAIGAPTNHGKAVAAARAIL